MNNHQHTDVPKEIERKYLIKKPDLHFLETFSDSVSTRITQTYLIQKLDGFNRRIRKRGTDHHWQYTYTQKRKISFGERIELENEISETQYLELLQEADPSLHPIQKIRCCIPYAGQLLEIDFYAFSEKYATLEIELPDIHTPVILPDWLEIIADVTDQPGYSNFDLSRTLAFPDEIYTGGISNG